MSFLFANARPAREGLTGHHDHLWMSSEGRFLGLGALLNEGAEIASNGRGRRLLDDDL